MGAVAENAAERVERNRPGMPLGVRIIALVIIVAAPALLLSLAWPGATSVALYGVLAAAFAWIPGGPRVAAIVVTSLAVLGSIVILLEGQTWALALILVLLGIGYGLAASRGIGAAVLQLPILVPYFMMDPPGIFTPDDPQITASYILATIAVTALAGLWTIFVLHKAVGVRVLKRIEVTDPRLPIVYGTILGIVAAAVMAVSTSLSFNTHWIWVTLTLYVLANPTQLVDWKRMTARVLGTLAGFAVITLLALVGVPDGVLMLLGLVTMWGCLYFMLTKKPYWQYITLLTMTVILMSSSDVNTVILDLERMLFTIIGAALAIFVAFVVNLVFYHRRGITRPVETV